MPTYDPLTDNTNVQLEAIVTLPIKSKLNEAYMLVAKLNFNVNHF